MANIIVLGGTGYTGAAVVAEARARGHQVTSVSRSKPTSAVDGVTYVASDASDIGRLLEDADVLVAALSPRGDTAGTLRSLYTKLAQDAAKNKARFIAIGGFSSTRPTQGAPRFIDSDDIHPQFRAEITEMHTILGSLETDAPAADWLFVSPAAEFGAHAPGEPLGHYRVSADVALFDDAGKSAISGADFAKAVVDEIERPTKHNAQIHFAY